MISVYLLLDSFAGNRLSYNYFTYHLQPPLLSLAAASPIT